MVKNFERRSRSVLAGKRATFSLDSASKTNEENYSAPPPHPHLPPLPPPPPSFSEESDRSESLRIATSSLLDANSIERLLKVAQAALGSRKRDPLVVDGGGGDCEETQRRTCTARPHREAQPRSEESLLRSIKIHKDDETKSPSPTEFQTLTNTRGVKSPSSSMHVLISSRDPKNEPLPNVTDSETRQLENTDPTGRHPSNSVAPQTPTDATPQSFGPERQIAPRGNGEAADALLCRGYSSQRRHGRKASLGTTDITRLIPTLVSENEGFRDREYQRKISLPSSVNNGATQNLTL